MNCLIELHYLPGVAYFSALLPFDKIILEKHEHFVKQSYRNRCHLLGANGVERLILPLTSKHDKVFITDVKIDYSQKWLNNHWRTIVSAYNNAPFFEHYADELHRTLFRQHAFLYDLNYELLTICRGWLKLEIPITETMAYDKEPDLQTTDLRNLVNAKKPDSCEKYFKPRSYTQVFGSTFAENMSIIDLVFCEGPNSRNVIASSARTD